MKRRRKRISAAERRARAEFRQAVLAKGECVVGDESVMCDTPLDPHHVLKEQALRVHTSTLSEDEALAIRFDPRCGVVLCRYHHNQVSRRFRRLKSGQVPASVFEFARDHGLEWLLEHELFGRGA